VLAAPAIFRAWRAFWNRLSNSIKSAIKIEPELYTQTLASSSPGIIGFRQVPQKTKSIATRVFSRRRVAL
jgi:hypothetical protein